MDDNGEKLEEASIIKDHEDQKVPFYKLFYFADRIDIALMIIGTLGAIGEGLTQPLMSVIFGKIVNSFGGASSSNEVLHSVSKVAMYYVYLPTGSGIASFLRNISDWNKFGKPNGTIGDLIAKFDSPGQDHAWRMRLRSGKKMNLESSPYPKQNPPRRNNELPLSSGMPTSVDTPPLPLSTQVVGELSQPEGPTVMTTSFIRQQIDLGIHDIMYHVFKQLADIVKPMVHNEVQQTNWKPTDCIQENVRLVLPSL
ncbi:hypothetical protein RND71_033651 [Anisodus tanguticus]|uniref:ABC transmembrane type-1 domain-containing protein n=1 Tax=Anisodus tanguticus TaxID=243964 RepID=A0AAE1RBA1_9SOLA|nr:hypothetical protein RND71_033651 [Anisodus tanguticus]